MNTSLPNDPQFNKYYEKHGKYLRLKGLRPKTIEAYARAIRRIGNYFDATNKLSYKVFFFTIYSMGLRLGEGIKLTFNQNTVE
jgi:hypothetical protein